MVLESDIALALEILQGCSKLVLRLVGILVRFRPSVQVHVDYLLSVKHDVDLVVHSGDDHMVPLAVLGHFLGGSQGIVDRSTATLSRPLDRTINLHFDSGLHAIPRVVGADKDTAVAFRLELQLKHEVAEAILGPDHPGPGLSDQRAPLEIVLFGVPPSFLEFLTGPATEVLAVEEISPSAVFRAESARGRHEAIQSFNQTGHSIQNQLL